DAIEATKQLVGNPAAAEQVFRQLQRWPVAAAAQRAANGATPQDDWMGPSAQMPFLIVQGLKDRVAPPEHGHTFRERLGSHVQVADVPEAGHMVFLEQPESVGDVIVSFLRQQTA